MTRCGLERLSADGQKLPGAFCNTFDLHKARTGLETKFSVILRVAVLRRFYFHCLADSLKISDIILGLHTTLVMSIIICLHVTF